MIPPSGELPISQRIDAFLDKHELIETLEANCGTISCWDFNTSLGNSIRDKYEGLYVKIVELSAVMVKKGAKGHFWIVASPEVCTVIENGLDKGTIKTDSDYLPMGYDGISYVATINRRWRLYVDPHMESNHLLIGVGCKKSNSYNDYARMSIANFIV